MEQESRAAILQGMERNMSGGSKPKKVALPPDPDPIPTPEELDIEATTVGQQARKKRKGRSSLILTDTLGGKNTLLGNT
jgi:hypothetical protein